MQERTEQDRLREELAKARRLARYIKRTAPRPKPKTRASDIAPRRIGDGIKPNHHARAISIASVFGRVS